MFPIINPIGHAPMFYAMTESDTVPFRRRTATKTAIYTTAILVIALLAGDTILRFFGIDLNDMRIAGGLLIAAAAWSMLGNKPRVSSDEHEAACDKVDISLTPMATPILAGPGAMSLAIGLTAYGKSPVAYGGYITGFILIGLLTLVSLRYSDLLVRVLSPNAIGALNRILGFFILAIGVDLMVDGVNNIFFKQL
ncbi:MAG: MarC family protein [Verrucomicrobiia bacterium]